MRLLLVMLLLSWGAAQHPNLSADVPASHGESPIEAPESNAGAETASEPSASEPSSELNYHLHQQQKVRLNQKVQRAKVTVSVRLIAKRRVNKVNGLALRWLTPTSPKSY